jgi:hypothetical protein
LRKKLDPSAEATLYSPRFQGAKAQLRLARTRAPQTELGCCTLSYTSPAFRRGYGSPEGCRGAVESPPSSFWAQRSAQPVGINIKVLSKCIRIVIVAFGSAPIPDNGRFAHGLRWAAAQTRLGTLSPAPFFASRGFKFLSRLSVPFANQSCISLAMHTFAGRDEECD